MDDRKILLISNDAGYLKEQLETEGLIDRCIGSSKVPRTIPNHSLLILNKIDIDIGDAERLMAHTAKGNSLILIRPCENVEKALGIQGSGFEREGWLRDEMSGFDYQVYGIVKYARGQSRYPLVKKTGDPTEYGLVVELPFEAGKVVILAFDFNRTLFFLLQGRTLRPDEIDDFGIQRIDFGRIVDREKRFVAQVDGLRRIFVGLIEEHLDEPLPKIWYFPHQSKGGLAFSHDSDGAKGTELERVNAYNIKRGLRPTTFMKFVDGNPASWRRLLGNGFDLQLHPVISLRLPKTMRKLMNAIRFRVPPSVKQFLFFTQKRIIELMAGTKIVGMRTHGLAWSHMNDYLKGMARSGIAYDSTFGSNFYFGYMYGSGLPYYLRIPDTLESVDVLEFPLHIMDSVFIKGFGREWRAGNVDKRICHFIHQAIEEDHSLITLNFHYFFMLNKQQRINNLELYKKIVDYAVQNHWFITNMTEFNAFWRNRNNLRVVGAAWDKTEKKLTFGLYSETDIMGLTYLLPVTFNTARLVETKEASGHDIVQNGRHYRMYAVDIKASSILNISARYAES